MRRLSCFHFAISTLVAASIAFLGCPYSGPNCGVGEINALNVDSAYCCKRTGQACTPGSQQYDTATNPCCSGSCTDAGACGCGGELAPCQTDDDCCSGTRCLNIKSFDGVGSCELVDAGSDAGPWPCAVTGSCDAGTDASTDGDGSTDGD